MSGSDQKPQSTIPMKRIVLATDFLESSRLALDYAVAFANRYRATMTIVHAFELSHEAEEAEMINRRPSLSREHAMARLEAFGSGVRRLGINVETDLREGDPCAAILRCAADKEADLLVLGTHGVYRGLQHLLVGSNAEKILLSAEFPTLTVGRHVMAGIDLDVKFKEIVCVSDSSSESVAAVRYAIRLARDLESNPVLLPRTPDDTPADGENAGSSAERFCAELAKDEQFQNREWYEPSYVLDRMVTDAEIIRQSMLCADRLFVIGVRTEGRLNRHLHASFAYKLLARSSCPVVSIHK